MKTKMMIFLAAAALAAFFGCSSSGGDDDPPPETKVYSGFDSSTGNVVTLTLDSTYNEISAPSGTGFTTPANYSVNGNLLAFEKCSERFRNFKRQLP